MTRIPTPLRRRPPRWVQVTAPFLPPGPHVLSPLDDAMSAGLVPPYALWSRPGAGR